MTLLNRLLPLIGHTVAPQALEALRLLNRPVELEVDPFHWSARETSVRFRNRLGIAGGVDKDAGQIRGWHHFGAGFVEVGTVTPEPQGPNPGWIMGRDAETKALWNRMGFPSKGGEIAKENLHEWRIFEKTHELERFPIFVNIGKNRNTSLEDANKDYASLIKLFARAEMRLADAFVINISSPNTKGLRDLFQKERLAEFLKPIATALTTHGTPGLLKLSPDLDMESLKNAVQVACDLGIDGFIATNTTIERKPGSPFPPEGGVSGGPLTERSRECLKTLIRELGDEKTSKLVVSAGGVMNRDEYLRRRDIGADLVQTYAALAFQGPWFFSKTLARPKS